MPNAIGPVQVSDKTVMIAGGAAVLLVVGGLWYAKKKLGDAAEAAAEGAKTVANYVANDAVNVTSDKNVANVVANKTLQAVGVLGTNNLTGKPNTIGSAAYEGVQWIKGLF